MSYDDVYTNEMPRSRPSDDEWPAGDPALAALAEDLRTVAGGPAPEPRPGLLAVMSQAPSGMIDSSPGRRKMLVKTLVGSLAAKVAFGIGVAAASVTAAGAGGVLPDPAQHAVASVVSAATPFAVPDPATVTPDVKRDKEKSSEKSKMSEKSRSSEKSKAKPAVADDDEAGDDESGTRPLHHGACVSAVAKTKAETGSHGKTVSSVARSDCGKTESTTSTTLAGSTTSSTSTTIGTANSSRGKSGNSGNGNGNSGNSGRGNSGTR